MASGIAETHNSCKIKHPIKSESSDQKNKVEELGTCNPIYTIDELISWKPKDQLCKWRKLVIPKAATTDHKVSGFGFNCQDSRGPQLTRLVGDSTPKTIVCHDYKGGYLEDKFPKGVETDDIYTFFHWSAIDIFIYFSHNIVSIPTLPWLNAAHKHGCKVLGTFITEFAEGEAAWREILKNEENFTAVIENLTEICTFFKFDGYLLNVENVIPAEHVPRLIDFVRLLTEKLHNVSPDFEVIWYDSVIATTGKLDWQNKLCPLNRVFFDLCDGIFLNYCWSENDLVESLSQADVRKHDVYVGVDIFGRGCHGGGGFNSSEAMKLIHKYGLSTAIFASAWTFEKCPDGGDFLSREILFWNSIWPYLFIHGPATLPFTTSFCIGRGKFKFHEGEIFGSEWGCLTYQQYQPSTCYSVGEEKNRKYKTSCLEINKTNSYSGGTCLKIVNKNNEKLELNDKMIRLFTCRFTCPGQIAIDFTYKNDDEKQNPSALVLLVQEKTRIRKVYLANIHFADLLSRNSSTDAYFELRNIQNNSYIEIVDYKLYSTHNDWNSCQFLYDLNGREIIEINFVHLGVGEILLGQLSIQESSHQTT